MGLFSKLSQLIRHKTPPPTPQAMYLLLAETQTYRVNVAGTSHRQESIAEIAQNPQGSRAFVSVIAYIKHEPNNPHDPNAMAVHIAGKQVGYLPKDLAATAVQWKMPPEATHLCVSAMITGGYTTDGYRTNHIIDLDIPSQLTGSMSPEKPPDVRFRNHGHSALDHGEDGSLSGEIWLPSAALVDAAEPLEAYAYAGEDWSTVGFYTPKNDSFGLGHKVHEMSKSDYKAIFGSFKAIGTITCSGTRIAMLHVCPTDKPLFRKKAAVRKSII